MLVILAEPFAYMIFAYIAWVIIFRIQKRPISKNPDFKSNLYLTTIVIVYILQPGIIKIMFELFKYFRILYSTHLNNLVARIMAQLLIQNII